MKSIVKKCICSIVIGILLCGSLFAVPASIANADSVSENRYYDAPSVMPASDLDETITFSRKEEELIEFPYAVPTYYTSSLANACGPIAGAIIVGYYDKYFEELIPDYVAYYPATGRYRRPDATYVPALMQSLYTSMQTNVVDVGVSVSECLSGLRSYVTSKNRNIAYTDIKTTSFNETVYKNAISNQQPSLLFCSSASLYFFRNGTTQDELLHVVTSSSHIVVAYGYYKIKYFNEANVNFRTDTYIKVSTGWINNSMGFLKANDTSWLDDAYVVNIY